ncbi:hypothetical protein RD792_001755 [Penstemon davidsonii]|uniref:Cytochrome P450 n=1 Tax=Penstemon davidsonii TaxID=160366 RepID=A0ABR0DP74_9LAMI|nr:hypothetical protein RD792_001755 [Penstemon davidsonii]
MDLSLVQSNICSYLHLLLYLLHPFFRNRHNLPPGPPPIPLLGNILQLMTKNPHVTVSNLSKKHGPLISLKLGTRLVVFASSRDSAKEILKTHDRDLSGRYAPKATPIDESYLKKFSLLWAADVSAQNWRSIRSCWKEMLFSNSALDFGVCFRERKIAEMVKFLEGKSGDVVEISIVVFVTVYNTLGNICFSRDMIGLEDEQTGSVWKEIIWRFMECCTTPVVGDVFPAIGVDFWLWGPRREARNCLDRMFGVWGDIVRRRREEEGGRGAPGNERDFLGFMLENEFSDLQIKYMLLEILPAGTGTVITTIEWAMSELIKNPDAMGKLREELRINPSSIRESDISQLAYLNSCIKETLRLHPPIAFLPHRAKSQCQVMNYTIPEDSLVMVNIWAMGRDPEIWEDPTSFKPERFLNSGLDFKGRDFEFLPFGAGRRMCPGWPFADKQLHLILASLIRCFNWSLPSNNGDKKFELDMNEKYAVPLRKETPLLLLLSRV